VTDRPNMEVYLARRAIHIFRGRVKFSAAKVTSYITPLQKEIIAATGMARGISTDRGRSVFVSRPYFHFAITRKIYFQMLSNKFFRHLYSTVCDVTPTFLFLSSIWIKLLSELSGFFEDAILACRLPATLFSHRNSGKI
jgi:hypothetical protein